METLGNSRTLATGDCHLACSWPKTQTPVSRPRASPEEGTLGGAGSASAVPQCLPAQRAVTGPAVTGPSTEQVPQMLAGLLALVMEEEEEQRGAQSHFTEEQGEAQSRWKATASGKPSRLCPFSQSGSYLSSLQCCSSVRVWRTAGWILRVGRSWRSSSHGCGCYEGAETQEAPLPRAPPLGCPCPQPSLPSTGSPAGLLNH